MHFNGRKIAFTDQGEGACVVLLHGFTESLDIWDDFSAELAKQFRVLCVDLPGHGGSECLGECHTMEQMADLVMAVLEHRGVQRCALLGHSMGGYVSMAFADKFPQRMNGLCLFHSVPTADPPQGREKRLRTIAFVKQHHRAFLSMFIPDLFAPASREVYAEVIEQLVIRARAMTADSIIAAQRGMMERPDRSAVLAAAQYPVLFILGKLDSRIDFQSALKVVALPKDAVLLSLGGVGHMGYIEARDKTLYAVETFLKGLNNYEILDVAAS